MCQGSNRTATIGQPHNARGLLGTGRVCPPAIRNAAAQHTLPVLQVARRNAQQNMHVHCPANLLPRPQYPKECLRCIRFDDEPWKRDERQAAALMKVLSKRRRKPTTVQKELFGLLERSSDGNKLQVTQLTFNPEPSKEPLQQIVDLFGSFRATAESAAEGIVRSIGITPPQSPNEGPIPGGPTPWSEPKVADLPPRRVSSSGAFAEAEPVML
mmetsp:Transcript_11068/g.17395  ORF Transcript_11068/g.17395 Transcript_11068/m.17395 type:complete len:213 (+) Transcript_11068:276-914(+)|eukprot:CAMPEP_0184292592 /NCGR_PEP_ID=MMETSP1049-20130417/4338_1 /TAXON_ID=77928 /ORGANISM="Proteomonas sulcata, Strain CCMP704" /LENGTH=212 /DNA_ID=CAMNT_0026600419 /DNA_START=268 /DNA_END=906 /DNA_ORIENTATION=-